MPRRFRLPLSALRFSVTAAIIVAGISGSAEAAAVEFVHVWPGWRTTESFMRMSEYFTGQEPRGDSVVLRTRPAFRAGYYFVARIKHPKTPVVGAKFVLHIIMPASPNPEVFTFSAEAPLGTNLFELGVTGADWPAKGTRPVAWMLELVSGDGHQIAEKESYLWSKPDKTPQPTTPEPDK